jgi:hypothetical protein
LQQYVLQPQQTLPKPPKEALNQNIEAWEALIHRGAVVGRRWWAI